MSKIERELVLVQAIPTKQKSKFKIKLKSNQNKKQKRKAIFLSLFLLKFLCSFFFFSTTKKENDSISLLFMSRRTFGINQFRTTITTKHRFQNS